MRESESEREREIEWLLEGGDLKPCGRAYVSSEKPQGKPAMWQIIYIKKSTIQLDTKLGTNNDPVIKKLI